MNTLQENAVDAKNKDNANKGKDRSELVLEKFKGVKSRIQHLNSRGAVLRSSVQEMSLSGLQNKYSKYGATKYVELELIFPENENVAASDTRRHASTRKGGGPTKLVIELAPDDVMPHSVY